MVQPRSLLVALLGALTMVLAACSNVKSAPQREPYVGTTTASEQGGVQQVTVTVDSSFRFDPSTITVHPGKVKITLVHNGSGGAPHNWQLTQFPSDFVPDTTAGQSNSMTFTAPSPGTYQFVCTIHTAQGMTGKLVVLPK